MSFADGAATANGAGGGAGGGSAAAAPGESPAVVLGRLEQELRAIDEQVRALDQQIFDYETVYLEQTKQSLLKVRAPRAAPRRAPGCCWSAAQLAATHVLRAHRRTDAPPHTRVQGFDFYLSTRPLTNARSRTRPRIADRIFSLSTTQNAAFPAAAFHEPQSMWEKENA